jgi:hypothetical protein
MSKERELLQKVVNHMWQGELVDEIKELLAQPEQDLEALKKDWVNFGYVTGKREQLLVQPEPEPVAWMVETHFNNEPIKEIHTVKPMERVYKYCIVTELYSAPLKPLTGIEISNGFKADDEAIHPYSYWAGVEFAEKHHGIGGGCDE